MVLFEGVVAATVASLPVAFFFPLPAIAAPFPFDFLPFFLPADAFKRSSIEIVGY